MNPDSVDAELLSVLKDIRNWLRAAAHRPVQELLEDALPTSKARTAYQLFDGTRSIDQVRVACKMSPNAVVALTARCIALGLMETTAGNKRIRLFDLKQFDIDVDDSEIERAG